MAQTTEGKSSAKRSDTRSHQGLAKRQLLTQTGHETGVYGYIQPQDWFCIIEALEAQTILEAFGNEQSPAITAALKRALSGPLQPIHETHGNRDGRNVWYELTLAAEWKLRGEDVKVDEPDLQLVIGNTTFLVACKRPSNAATIEKNIREAFRQLTTNLDKMPSNTFGVAAINLTRIFNPGDKVYTGNPDHLGSYIKRYIDQHRKLLREVGNKRICCVIFDVTTPSIGVRGDDLVRSHFAVIQGLNPSAEFLMFRKRMERILT